jgi:hypothetical protein
MIASQHQSDAVEAELLIREVHDEWKKIKLAGKKGSIL